VTLTDYHTHLRPDDPEATAAKFFTERNVVRYLECASERNISELGFAEHVYRFQESLTVWRHPFWLENATDRLDDYVEFLLEMKSAGYPIKLGLELDFIPGHEPELAALVEGRPFDFVIGSVHFIADRAVDHDAYDAWRQSEPDQVWREYFSTLGDAAVSGLFDVLAHLDLVKVWGAGRPPPSGELRSFYELAIDKITAADVAIEVSTAGLRKPASEMYPSPELLAMCVEAGKPVSLSSDAHEASHVGYEYDRALELIRDVGVDRLCVFDGRQRREEPIG
jgi:histidinol-phosphatase (PHP family)